MSVYLNYWVLQTFAMLLTGLLIPGLKVSGPVGAFAAVVGLAFFNATVWDAALFFSIPDSATAHALVLFLSNGVIFWIFVKLMPGIGVEGITPALVAPLVFTVSSIVIREYGGLVDWSAVLDGILLVLDSLKDYLYETAPTTPAA